MMENFDNLQSILLNEYGLKVTRITKMESYYNQNYLVSCYRDDSATGEIRAVVKIFQETGTSYFDNGELQHAFMAHLTKHDFKCSQPFRTKTGNTFVRLANDGKDFLLNVLTYLPGKTVNVITAKNDDYLKICYLVGEKLGKLHVIGQNFDFKFENRNPDFPYLPENALNTLQKISSVEDPDITRTIRDWMTMYKENFLPELKNLRKGFIHNDFSDCNVILMENQGGWDFGGIIDFEHCHYGYLVGDLGVSIAYMLMKAASLGCNVILAASAQIRGYQSINPLTSYEKKVVLDAIMSRVCVSYVLGCCRAKVQPENSAFIFLQSQHIPKLLKEMDKIGREDILEAILQFKY